MTAADTLRTMCTSIASTFYPDSDVCVLALEAAGIDANGDADFPSLFKVAARLVIGYVEQSRSEGGISVSVNSDAVRRSVLHWCGVYGVRPEEVLGDSIGIIKDCTDIW